MNQCADKGWTLSSVTIPFWSRGMLLPVLASFFCPIPLYFNDSSISFNSCSHFSLEGFNNLIWALPATHCVNIFCPSLTTCSIKHKRFTRFLAKVPPPLRTMDRAVWFSEEWKKIHLEKYSTSHNRNDVVSLIQNTHSESEEIVPPLLMMWIM